MSKKKQMYVVYRRGMNTTNQSTREVMPVAIVEATCREEAAEDESDGHSRWMKLNPEVDLYNKQFLYATPFSRAPMRDIDEVQQAQAHSLGFSIP